MLKIVEKPWGHEKMAAIRCLKQLLKNLNSPTWMKD